MSSITLERRDESEQLSSYTKVYKTSKLYLFEDDYRNNILKIVKKAILGTNFIYYYSKKKVFLTSILNLFLININFLIFPQLLSPSKEFIESNDNGTQEQLNSKNKYYNMIMINVLDICAILYFYFEYKFNQNKIIKYMNKLTQCAIAGENNLMRKHYNCQISSKGNFDIEINTSKNNPKSESYFFEYVINFPNISHFSEYLYQKLFLPKEKEIINKIKILSKEIEKKHKKQLLKNILLIFVIIVLLTFCSVVGDGKKEYICNFFGMLILLIYVIFNNSLSNTSEQIKEVSTLNNEYIIHGYYIYINKDIISLFFVKEEYRNLESINNISNLVNELLLKFELI